VTQCRPSTAKLPPPQPNNRQTTRREHSRHRNRTGRHRTSRHRTSRPAASPGAGLLTIGLPAALTLCGTVYLLAVLYPGLRVDW
jgi:hypothetical protein